MPAGAAGAVAVAIEAIKLVEGGLADLCDEVWLVTCAPDVQLERLVERGTGAEDARDRIAAQGDLTTRLRPAATHVIDTNDAPDGDPLPGHGAARRGPGPPLNRATARATRCSPGGLEARRVSGAEMDAREVSRETGWATSAAWPSASDRGSRWASARGSAAVLRTTDTRLGSAARSG